MGASVDIRCHGGERPAAPRTLLSALLLFILCFSARLIHSKMGFYLDQCAVQQHRKEGGQDLKHES